MRERELHILIVFTRLAASTLIVPVALVAGMLSFPTTCQCGADQPHEHPIFGLASHHHGNQHTRPDGPHDEAIRAGAHGVSVQTPAGQATAPLTAIGAPGFTLHALPRTAMTIENVIAPDGMGATPDVPPPQA